VVSKQTNNTVYQQQLRYFRKIERNICPIKAFAANLYNFIKQSIDDGYSIVLSLYRNENMTNGRIQKLFSKLGIKESMSRFTDAKPSPTFYKGSK